MADDFLANTLSGGRVTVGGSTSGSIETGYDNDWFAVSLVAGTRYQFSLNGISLADPYLSLYSGNGGLITSDDDSGAGLNSLISYTATVSGTYFLGARAYSTGTGSYTLGVAGGAGTSDDYVASTLTAGRVAAGSSSTGNIEISGDNDWFAISLTAGARYTFSLNGSTLADPYLSLYSGTGALITSNDDANGSLNSQISYTAASTGTYYLGARAYSTGTGTYTVSATGSASTDDFAASTATTGRLTVGSSVSGRVDSVGDNDWFAVTLTAGTAYQFGLNGATLADPYLTLYSAAGATIASDDDSGSGFNSLLSYTPTTSGTYYLGARGLGSATGTYSLTASGSAAAPAPTTPTTGTGAFTITVSYTGDSQYQSYFTAAAARWSQIITTDLPDVTTSTWGRIDDLLIQASVQPIDGRNGVLGQAAPTAFRTSSQGGLPYLGFMQFDSADLASMASSGTLGDVILHEMGHVLGLGTLWQSRGLVSGLNYTGAAAVAAYRSVTGNNSLTSVPLESTGGSGTRGSHWSEATFDRELMTGYAESAPPMPISIVTVGGLADLGYGVNYGAADAFRA